MFRRDTVPVWNDIYLPGTVASQVRVVYAMKVLHSYHFTFTRNENVFRRDFVLYLYAAFVLAKDRPNQIDPKLKWNDQPIILCHTIPYQVPYVYLYAAFVLARSTESNRRNKTSRIQNILRHTIPKQVD
jgi:hypothetical protein